MKFPADAGPHTQQPLPAQRGGELARSRLTTMLTLAGATAIMALVLWSYRELYGRQFAADDYQWLVHTRGTGMSALLGRAFDPGAQQHFFRPLIWLLIGGEQWLFGLNARPYHMVSLGLHLLNAGLLGCLAWQLIGVVPRRADAFWRIGAALLAAAIVALHPAPFEAVVWISAQSELLGTALLLLTLNIWRAQGMLPALLATGTLALAMLAKESAVLGLPLLLLLEPKRTAIRWRRWLLPAALTAAFLALQVYVARTNSVLREGQYGFGQHMLANPLRSLALLVAPLGGSEHADAAWLVPAGAVVALLLALIAIVSFWRSRAHAAPARPACWRLVLALGLTLAPTAPFLSPPDSRYLYLPVVMAGLLTATLVMSPAGSRADTLRQRSRAVACGITALALAAVLAGWAPGEIAAREWRFGAGSGPGGSLWRLASDVCASATPERLIVVDPPVAPEHAEAIVELACGNTARAVIVHREQLADALRARSVVIAFPGGSAAVEQWTSDERND